MEERLSPGLYIPVDIWTLLFVCLGQLVSEVKSMSFN